MNRRDIVRNLVNESLLLEAKRRAKESFLKRKAKEIGKEALSRIWTAAAGIDKRLTYGLGGNEPQTVDYSGPTSKLI